MTKEINLNEKVETGCCPRFNPDPWDSKSFEWHEKKFIKGRVFTCMNVPINFGPVITKLMKKVDAAGAKTPDNLCLSDHTSVWNMNIYLATDKEVAGAENITLSGKFFSKVYEGDFKDTGIWCKDFESYAKKQGRKIKKWYMWYTTCPKCAKVYGHNYVVIVAKVD